MSMLSAGQLTVHPTTLPTSGDDSYRPNPCSFYLLNLAIDTTLGIPILILLLRVLTSLFLLTPLGSPPESLQSGSYGHPPKTLWWLKQSLIYFLGLLNMKGCVLFIFTVLPWISRVGDWALSWTEGNEVLQVGFVMLLFPCIMNAAQYWIIDAFIKEQKPAGHQAVAQEDDDNDDHHGREPQAYEEVGPEESAGEEEEEDKKVVQGDRPRNKKRLPSELIISPQGVEYDTETDGQESPTVVDSGSGSGSSGVVKPAGEDDEVKENRK